MKGMVVKFETVRGGIPKLSIEFEKGTAGLVAKLDGIEVEVDKISKALVLSERYAVLMDIEDRLSQAREDILHLALAEKHITSEHIDEVMSGRT